MPRTNDLYVCPAWKDNQAPALDAAELLAIGQSIVANQNNISSHASLIAALQTAVNSGAKIAVGSYVGTGTYGASNPCSLTFDFPPQLVVIFYDVASSLNSKQAIFVRPQKYDSMNISTVKYEVTWGNRSLSWITTVSSGYSFPTGVELNQTNVKYMYLGIG